MRKLKIHPLVTYFTLLAAGTAFAMYYLFTGMEHCVSHTLETISGPAHYDVRIMEEGCYGIAGSDTISVVLMSKSKKRDKTIFVFGREHDEPVVTWNNDNLQISIPAISDIGKQVKEFDGVKISYEIGRIVYPAEQP